MSPASERARRRREKAIRVFEQERWGNVELLDGWDGVELDELKVLLSDEEFQTLVDRLQEDRDERR